MISSQQTCNFKPMQISRQMPQKVADVAKMLNAMKLDSDPCHGMCMELVSPTSRMEMEGMLRKTDALVGIRGKSILEIGCGPVSGKASVFTDALEKLEIEPERYVGVDPSIMYMPGYGSGKIAYAPFSFYSSDFMGLETLGKFDIVFSAAFFGIPVSHLGSKVMRMALDVIQKAGAWGTVTYWSQYKHLFEAWKQDRFYNGPFGAFMEFMTHERSLSLLSENGRIAHMVRYGEPAPDFSVAKAAGLALEAHEQLRNGYGAFAEAFVFKRQE